MAVSDALTDVAEQTARLDESDGSGFRTIHTDHERGALTVYWSGEPPPALLDLARRQPGGIKISVERSSYSRAELDRGAEAIARVGLYERFDIMFVDPDVESGITIGTGRSEGFTEDDITLIREISKVNPINVEYDMPNVFDFVSTDDAGL